MSTSAAQYSGVEFAVNGIVRGSVGALTENASFTVQQSILLKRGDTISFTYNERPGVISFAVVHN